MALTVTPRVLPSNQIATTSKKKKNRFRDEMKSINLKKNPTKPNREKRRCETLPADWKIPTSKKRGRVTSSQAGGKGGRVGRGEGGKRREEEGRKGGCP